VNTDIKQMVNFRLVLLKYADSIDSTSLQERESVELNNIRNNTQMQGIVQDSDGTLMLKDKRGDYQAICPLKI